MDFFLTAYKYPPPPGYIFLDELGAGGCGKVHLAKHCFTGCLFAVKCVIIIDMLEEDTKSVSSYVCLEVDVTKMFPNISC